MNIAFQIKNRYFPRKFTESVYKGTQTPNQMCSLVENRHFMVYLNIYIYIFIYLFKIYILFEIKLLQTALKLPLVAPSM